MRRGHEIALEKTGKTEGHDRFLRIPNERGQSNDGTEVALRDAETRLDFKASGIDGAGDRPRTTNSLGLPYDSMEPSWVRRPLMRRSGTSRFRSALAVNMHASHHRHQWGILRYIQRFIA